MSLEFLATFKKLQIKYLNLENKNDKISRIEYRKVFYNTVVEIHFYMRQRSENTEDYYIQLNKYVKLNWRFI